MNTETNQLPAGTKFPDFSEEQKAILNQIATTPDYRASNGFKWSLAFRDHPEWKQKLLTEQGRPISHLWHASKELQSGTLPDRPFRYHINKKRGRRAMSRKVELQVVKRGGHKKRKAWWIERGLKHPSTKNVESGLPEPATRGPEPANYCPHCGAHRSHFGNRA
jgi:hypothetical protein